MAKVAKLIAELAEGPAKDFFEFLSRMLPALKYKVVLLLHTVGTFIGTTLPTHLSENVENLVKTLALRFVANNPQSRKAAEDMCHDLVQAMRLHYLIYGSIIFSCFILLLVVTGSPLIYKLMSRPKLLVFISFNRAREDIARIFQQYLEGEGSRAFRIPFQEDAAHQAIVMRATEGIKSCDSFVCLPGSTQSYVDHEVLAAETSGKPIIFLISEKSGTLPDTADKRYPMFRLETTVREQFKPLLYFISYVGADLKSTWKLCHRALFHPLIVISTSILFPLGGIGLVSLWAYCLFDAHTESRNLTDRIPAYTEVATPVVLANFFVISLLASLAFVSFTYSSLFVLGLGRQLRARRRARLKAVSAQFNRDDWIGVIPDLSPGENLYESLFEAVPLAHHEIEERVSS